jgi:hypothetical protein
VTLTTLYKAAAVCWFGLGLTALGGSTVFCSAFVVVLPALLVAYLGTKMGSRPIGMIRSGAAYRRPDSFVRDVRSQPRLTIPWLR